jgi:UrcA family protein
MNAKRGIVSGLMMAGAIVAFTAAGAAHAHTNKAGEIVGVAVSYGDLNLQSEAGIEALMRRIETAASKACGGRPARHELQRHSRYNNCVKDATDRAVTDVNASTVTAWYTNESNGAFNAVEKASYPGY